MMDGVLVVDKPAGPTSHDIVARVRRALRTKRVGHTGTLDPLATGVLPLVVGRATRLAQFLTADQKEYLATVRFGRATETYDAEREVAPVAPTISVSAESVEAALVGFRGTYLQVPPPYSAKKIAGTPAYRLARSNEAVEIKAVEVTVHALDLLACQGDLATLRIVCSSGFYVRALAHELGQRLGCGAYLAALRRTRAGQFSLDEAATIDAIESDGMEASARLVPMERLLPALPAVILNERGARRAAHGNALGRDDLEGPASWPGEAAGVPGGRVRLFDASGLLLGIADQATGDVLRPAVVLV